MSVPPPLTEIEMISARMLSVRAGMPWQMCRMVGRLLKRLEYLERMSGRSYLDCWQILGIKSGTGHSPEELRELINRNWRKLAKECHPDLKGDTSTAEMATLNNARAEAFRWLERNS